MKKFQALIISIAVVAVLSGGMAYTIYCAFFKPNNSVVPAFNEGELNLVIGGEVITGGKKPILEDNEILLALDVVKSHIDPYIYWDTSLKKVTVTTKDRVIRMKTDSLNALVNNKPMALDIPVSDRNGTVYVPIKFLSDFYKIDIRYIKDTNVVLIDFRDSTKQLAEVHGKGAVIRNGMSIRDPIIRKINLPVGKTEDYTLRVFGEHEKWYKVRTTTGEIGYIEKKFIVLKPSDKEKTAAEEEKSRTWKPGNGRINLVWDQIWSSKKINLSAMPDMEGIDVISPTWFQLSSKNGKLINRASPQYVEWAHSKGYKVWAVLNNDFSHPEVGSKFLANTDYRDSLIKQLLAYSSLYKLDGINIDFESLDSSDRNNLTEFIREIAPFLREQGLAVSMDINEAACYDRKALGDAVDYIALMAYDQHYRNSPEAGSVSQVSWTESLLKKYLKDIASEKLLLGMPFYTRLWKVETDADGKESLSSKALSMEDARKELSVNKAVVSWDENSGQFYSEYKKGNAVYKVWLEDSNSISLRLSLVYKYSLAGAAGWSRNFAEPAIWDVLKNNLKRVTSYSDWEDKNADKRYIYW